MQCRASQKLSADSWEYLSPIQEVHEVRLFVETALFALFHCVDVCTHGVRAAVVKTDGIKQSFYLQPCSSFTENNNKASFT